MSSPEFKEILRRAKQAASEMTPEERERQRRSFAYGNNAIENPMTTKASVERAANRLAQKKRTKRA